MCFISKDLEVSILEELLSTFEIHESRCAGLKKESRQNIALKAKTDELDSETSLDDDETTLMVRKFKNI